MKKNRLTNIFILLLLLTLVNSMFVPVFGFGPSNNNIYQGIDVSSWQGNINFSLVRQSGIDVVYIKSSEGSTYIDPYFEQNYNNAKANGLKVGFYHYVTARSTYQAKQQANFFARVISGKSVDCRLAMDFESFGNLSVSEINEISRVFLETLQDATKKEVVIYSNSYTARTILSSNLTIYPLWVANYDVSEPGGNGKWDTWVGWQYTSTGNVRGISGYVDRNQFTEDIFLSDNSELPPPTVDPEIPPDNNQTITYTVKPGDTLSKIALKYGTTVSNLVDLNNIRNPNLIFPGQILTINNSSGSSNANQTIYIVKSGDTLSHIALRYNTTVSSLVRINNIKNPNLIFPGQRIVIYSQFNVVDEGQNSCGKILYKIKYGDTLNGIALKYGTTVNAIVRLNDIKNPNLIYAGETIRISNCRN